jgi:PAS domain S-box-containing protein
MEPRCFAQSSGTNKGNSCMNVFSWRSLKTRVTLLMVVIFLAGVWLLAFYASQMLRADMERLLADQQSSTVSYVAAELNRQFQERVVTLEKVARSIDQSMLDHPAALQAMLEDRAAFLDMFNAGVVAVSLDGTAIADVPSVVGRRGTNYASNVATQTALTAGRSVIGRPLIGRVLQQPLFNINTPIKDARGRVIGALFGVINLAKPNFLDSIGEHSYGKSGGYLVIDPEHRLIVTATDRSRVLQPLPEPGNNEMTDRRMLGFLNPAVAVNSLGADILSSASRIPLAGWVVVATLPAKEAFAPIRDMQRRIVLVSMVLTLIAGTIAWWLIRRQFAPLLAAASALNTMAGTDNPPQALAITTRDEIGVMIGSFNGLLETLRRREAALQDSEYRWKFAIEGAGDGLWDWNVTDRTVFRSKQLKGMLGFSEDEIGNGVDEWMQHVHPDDKAASITAVQACFDIDHPVFVIENRVRCKNASYKWMLARGMVVSRRADGKPLRMIGTQTDITERKRVDEKISGLNRDFVSFLENTSDFVYFKDENSRFRFCSQTMANITGHASWRDMIGKHDLEVFPKETAQIYYEEELTVFREGKPLLNMMDPYFDASGNRRWVSTNKWPLFDHQNHETVVGLFGISRDITDDKRTSEALQIATVEAERANLAKSAFLAAVSHELRTPLNAVVGLTGLLADSPLSRRQRDYADKIQLSAHALHALIDNILDFSKIEAGELRLEQAPFSLSAILRTTAAVLGVGLRNKPVEAMFEVTPDVPDALFGDALRLQQILLNLTSNAAKFTNAGEIVVTVCCLARGAEQATLQFAVRDTGIGIAPEKLGPIFDAFIQADTSTSRMYGGTGLGLAISARLATLMGGQIGVNSAEGRGSEFRLDVPLTLGPSTPPTAMEGIPANLSVLIVDDHPLVRDVLTQTCTAFGWKAIAVDSAAAGLEALRRSAAEQCNHDLLLLDWRMPGMDGLAMLREAYAAPDIVLPLVVLMASIFELEQAAAASDDVYLDGIAAKPMTPANLLEAVTRAYSGEYITDQSPLGKSDRRLARMRLLVAEDNEINQEVVEQILTRAGAEVVMAADGVAAVAALRLADARFDAVLMDIQMPMMDGYTATRIIRDELGLLDLPIIAVTAFARPEDREKSRLAGMVGHVVKPIDVEDLLDLLVEERRGGVKRATEEPDYVEQSMAAAMKLAGLDVAAGLKTFGGDERRYRDILRRFMVQHGGDVDEARRLFHIDNPEAAISLLHGLSGVASLLQAKALARMAATAEGALRDGNAEVMPILFDELQAAMLALSESIHEFEAIQADA